MNIVQKLYTFIKSPVTYRTCYNQSTGYTKYGSPARRLATPIGSGTTMQENQLAAQIAARHNIFPQMAPYMSSICTVSSKICPVLC